MQQLRHQSSLCDARLRPADGPDVLAHKVLLAASSDFFRALYAGAGASMREGTMEASDALDLPGTTYAGLRSCIDALYGQPLRVCNHG